MTGIKLNPWTYTSSRRLTKYLLIMDIVVTLINFIAESLYQKVLMPFENISTNPLKYSE